MKSSRINIGWIVFTLLWVLCNSSHAEVTPQKDIGETVLVELFTSEGCSSCPPADALLRQINGQQMRPGKLIVGISEHVTYWNSLGWKDPFSATAYTERQEAYAQRFGTSGPYTPQMVINGQEQFVGSDKTALLRALAKQSQPSPLSLRIESMAIQGDHLALNFTWHGTSVPGSTQIFAVIADDTDQSSVLRGENSGRTLVHASVARSISHISTLRGPGKNSVSIVLPPVTRGGLRQAQHVILFAQKEGLGQIMGVTSEPIPLSEEVGGLRTQHH
ncbi:MAG: DUF1223 domain-containing protein [Granulicella sp.]